MVGCVTNALPLAKSHIQSVARGQPPLPKLRSIYDNRCGMAFAQSAYKSENGLSGDGVDVAIALAICLFTTTVGTGLRWWALKIQNQNLFVADYLLLISLFLFYSYAVVTYLMLNIGYFGYPISETAPWRRIFSFKCLFYSQLVFAVGMTLTKVSVMSVSFRMVNFVLSATLRVASRIIITICVCWGIMVIFGGILGCLPLDYHWNLKNTAGHCISQEAGALAMGIIDVISNASIALTLTLLCRNLRVTKPKRLAILGVFVLGAFGIGISIARMTIQVTVDFSTFGETGKMVLVWTAVEWATAITVYNALILGPIVDRAFPHEEVQESIPFSNFAMLDSVHSSTYRGGTYTAKAAATKGASSPSSRARGRVDHPSHQAGYLPSPELGEVRIQTEWIVERS